MSFFETYSREIVATVFGIACMALVMMAAAL
ncbi:hypothetical protein J2X37_002134 [Croceicoccus sp. BE223]|nr:hypothetical protein [Croceicoccus sp. BE223]